MSISSRKQAAGLPATAKNSLIRGSVMIVVAGIVLYVLSGGFPPTSWMTLIQVLSQWRAMSAALGGAAVLSLVILISQSLLFAVAWGLFIWVIAREVSAYKELQTQISLVEKQATLQTDVTSQNLQSVAVATPDLQTAALPFVPGALRAELVMASQPPQRPAAAAQRPAMASDPFEMQPPARSAAQAPMVSPQRQEMPSNPFEMQPPLRPVAQVPTAAPQRQVPVAAPKRQEMPSNPFEMQPTSQVQNLEVPAKPVAKRAPSGGLRYSPTADEARRVSPFEVSVASVDQKIEDDQALADPSAPDTTERRSGGLRYTPANEKDLLKPAKMAAAETSGQQEASPFDDVPKTTQRKNGGLRMSSTQQRAQQLRRGKSDPFAVVPDVFKLFQEEQNNQKTQGQQEVDPAASPVRSADNLGEDEFLYGNPFAGDLPEVFNYDKDLKRSVLDIKEGLNDKKDSNDKK